jgi:hypothetical protein
LGLVLALIYLEPPLAAENAVEEGWQTYIDDTYKVTLSLPGEWGKDPLIYQDRPYFSSERKPHSVIHSFQLEVMGDESTTPEQACTGEVEHVLKPFGAKATIRWVRFYKSRNGTVRIIACILVSRSLPFFDELFDLS